MVQWHYRIQAIAFSINLIATSPQAIIIGQLGFTISSVIVLTAGTVFMWRNESVIEVLEMAFRLSS